jgi:hypothetical protein
MKVRIKYDHPKATKAKRWVCEVEHRVGARIFTAGTRYVAKPTKKQQRVLIRELREYLDRRSGKVAV